MTGRKRTNAAHVAGRHRAARRPAAPGPAALTDRVALPCAPVEPPRRTAPALLALCVLGASTLAACGGGSSSTTTLRGATGVTVVAADGSTHPGVDGERLISGETVRTTSARAAVVTGSRITTLGPATSLVLVGRDALRLDQGTVVVDRRHGADLTLAAGPVSVSDLGRTAVRVERGFAVRVAVYDGGGVKLTAGQRSTTLAALHELDVPGASLPATSSPLALRDDALDALGSPDLVAVDVALVQRAAGLDVRSAAGAADAVRSAVPHVLPAAVTAVSDAGVALSERVLPVAIARADPHAAPATAYATVSSLRQQGGSWGVVAALVGAGLADVQQEITDLLDTPVDAAALTAPTPAAAPSADGLEVLLAAAATTPTAATPAAAAPVTSAAPTARATSPAPTVAPTTTPPVTGLLGTVLGLLPGATTTSPAAGRSPAARASASPTPSPTASGGIVGGLLHGLL